MGEILLRQEKVSLAVAIGEAMLKNGGEVYRVEDTLKHILTYYGFVNFNVFVISNGIFVTVDENGERPVSCVRNVHSWELHLEKIADLNSLSRDICSGKCNVEAAKKRLKEIVERKSSSILFEVIATGVGCGSFCYLFGGRFLDMTVAFGIGCLLKIFLLGIAKQKISKFIGHIVGSVMVTILAVTAHCLIDKVMVDKVIIGSIMILVPGVTLTTSIRDFFSGDYLSGGIHLIDALLTAVCIAIGVGVAINAFVMMGLV